MTFEVLRYFVKYVLDTLLRTLPPAERQKGIFPFLSKPPLFWVFLTCPVIITDLYFQSPPKAILQKKAPFGARVPRHFGRNLSS